MLCRLPSEILVTLNAEITDHDEVPDYLKPFIIGLLNAKDSWSLKTSRYYDSVPKKDSKACDMSHGQTQSLELTMSILGSCGS